MKNISFFCCVGSRVLLQRHTRFNRILLKDFLTCCFCFCCCCCCCCFCRVFFHDHSRANHRTAGEGGGHFFNSLLPLPPASQTVRHYPSGYSRGFTSAHRQNRTRTGNLWFPSSERKSLTTKLQLHGYCLSFYTFFNEMENITLFS